MRPFSTDWAILILVINAFILIFVRFVNAWPDAIKTLFMWGMWRDVHATRQFTCSPATSHRGTPLHVLVRKNIHQVILNEMSSGRYGAQGKHSHCQLQVFCSTVRGRDWNWIAHCDAPRSRDTPGDTRGVRRAADSAIRADTARLKLSALCWENCTNTLTPSISYNSTYEPQFSLTLWSTWVAW